MLDILNVLNPKLLKHWGSLKRDRCRMLPNAEADCASMSLVPRSRLHFKPKMYFRASATRARNNRLLYGSEYIEEIGRLNCPEQSTATKPSM
ncbi:hypothetical protein J6590_066402 [Homalodisca vitripennis]|nr:hypothetical protein J6590_066402 [Homalodisca vitripennis]